MFQYLTTIAGVETINVGVRWEEYAPGTGGRVVDFLQDGTHAGIHIEDKVVAMNAGRKCETRGRSLPSRMGAGCMGSRGQEETEVREVAQYRRLGVTAI